MQVDIVMRYADFGRLAAQNPANVVHAPVALRQGLHGSHGSPGLMAGAQGPPWCAGSPAALAIGPTPAPTNWVTSAPCARAMTGPIMVAAQVATEVAAQVGSHRPPDGRTPGLSADDIQELGTAMFAEFELLGTAAAAPPAAHAAATAHTAC